jgi:hypothetical protein
LLATLPDREHRALRSAHHTLGRRSDKQPLDHTGSVHAHDDQRAATLGGYPKNLAIRLSQSRAF